MKDLTVRISDELYEELSLLAQIHQRSVEEEVAGLLAHAVGLDREYPDQAALLDRIWENRFTPPPGMDVVSLIREARDA